MRSRAIREGSVGLLVIVSLGLFAMVAFWLRGVRLGNQSYQVIVEFSNATGMQVGTPVRYRGVKVGRVMDIKAESNQVEVVLEITSSDLVIPRDVSVQSNQSGLLSESYVDIIPKNPLPQNLPPANPLSPDCPVTIICDQTRLLGQNGIGLERLIGSLVDFTELYTSEELFANLNQAAQKTAIAAGEVTKLSGQVSDLINLAKTELTTLSASVDQGIGTFSSELTSISGTLRQSTNEVSRATIESANSVQQAANQVSVISDEIQMLIASNRSTLATTLGNIEQITGELSVAVASINPLLNQIDQGQLLNNLEVLSANAAEASDNLLDLSRAMNDPDVLILLQQTLDSARTTLQNIEKITSDFDELIGDPEVRESLREIINGLGNILAYTQQLEQQTTFVQTIAPLSDAVHQLDTVAQYTSVQLVLSKPEEKSLKTQP